MVEVGKLAVAFLILRAERSSKLKKDERSGLPNTANLAETWLTEFLSMSLSFVRRNSVTSMFENITFINFNYDRVLECFLEHSLQQRASLTEDVAREMIEGLNVIRPYGSLGKLPWPGRRGVAFGGSGRDNDDLPTIASGIQTYAEETDNARVRGRIGKAFQDAELTIFIGFGYHQQNMAMLATPSGYRQVYGTALDIDPENYPIFVNEFTKTSGSTANLFNKTGYRMLHDLRPSIMAVIG
jgi:hypothetical protein